jgi:hypothetical protein
MLSVNNRFQTSETSGFLQQPYLRHANQEDVNLQRYSVYILRQRELPPPEIILNIVYNNLQTVYLQ